MKNGIFRSHISLSVLIQELFPNIVRTDVMNKRNIRKHAGIKIPPERFWINTKEYESASLHVRKKSPSLSTCFTTPSVWPCVPAPAPHTHLPCLQRKKPTSTLALPGLHFLLLHIASSVTSPGLLMLSLSSIFIWIFNATYTCNFKRTCQLLHNRSLKICWVCAG